MRTVERNRQTEELIAITRQLQAEAEARVKDFDCFTPKQLEPIHEIARWYLEARRQKAFAVSDVLRQELTARGVMMEDLTDATYAERGLHVNLLRESPHHRKKRLTKKPK